VQKQNQRELCACMNTNNKRRSGAEWHAVLLPVTRDDKVADPPDLLDKVALAQERLGEVVLDRAVDVVHEATNTSVLLVPDLRAHDTIRAV
jgi:hypothetical protein